MPEYVKIIILVLTSAAAGVVAYFTNKHFSAGERSALLQSVKIAVEAAEQIFKVRSGAGAEKKAHVVQSLFELGFLRSKNVADLSQEINDMIEAAVYALK